MELLFVVIFLLVFCFFSWLISHLSGNDKTKLFRFTSKVYAVMIPVSFIQWIYDAIRIKNILHKELSLIFILNVVIALVIWLLWILVKKIDNKNSYYKRRSNYASYLEGRFIMLFTFCIVCMPILNIISLIYFIQSNFL